jgi:hypothetical protein
MQKNIHFIMTASALMCFGIIAVKPEALTKIQNEERVCKLNRGKMDCYFKYTNYRINHVSDIPQNLN